MDLYNLFNLKIKFHYQSNNVPFLMSTIEMN